MMVRLQPNKHLPQRFSQSARFTPVSGCGPAAVSGDCSSIEPFQTSLYGSTLAMEYPFNLRAAIATFGGAQRRGSLGPGDLLPMHELDFSATTRRCIASEQGKGLKARKASMPIRWLNQFVPGRPAEMPLPMRFRSPESRAEPGQLWPIRI